VILCVAGLVRGVWIPVFERHVFDGHEAEYLALLQGTWHGEFSTRVVPLLGLLTRGLGRVLPEPMILVLLPVMLSLVSIAAVMDLVRRKAGNLEAFLSGIFLAFLGNHAFWSSSAYHVMHPLSLVVVALWAYALERRAWTLVSAVLFGLGVGMRVELAFLALPATLLRDQTHWRSWGAWVGVAAVIALATGPSFLTPGSHPPALWETLPLALGTNIRCACYLAPWANAGLLGLAVLTALPAFSRLPRLAAAWTLLAVGMFLLTACFADQGFRNVLPATVALCVLEALGVGTLLRRGGARRIGGVALGFIALALLLRDQAVVARDYYAPFSPIQAHMDTFAPIVTDDDAFQGCTWVSEEPPLPGQELPSHLTLTRIEGCVLWGEEPIHETWNSRSVRDRAVRMHAVYDLEPVAVRVWPERPGHPHRLVWRIVGR